MALDAGSWVVVLFCHCRLKNVFSFEFECSSIAPPKGENIQIDSSAPCRRNLKGSKCLTPPQIFPREVRTEKRVLSCEPSERKKPPSAINHQHNRRHQRASASVLSATELASQI